MIIKKPVRRPFLFAILMLCTTLSGCLQTDEPFILYAGKGLKVAVDEVVRDFEQQEKIPVTVIYAGSNTLLTTLSETLKGDVFLPGSKVYIKKAAGLVTHSAYVAKHIPTFVVRENSPKKFNSYKDLLVPGVIIAVGNKDMAAIGRVAASMLKNISPEDSFKPNVIITASTVNELLQLVINNEVDAALIWTDMLTWEVSNGLKPISIPEHINKPKEIWVAELAFSKSPEKASAFVSFMSTQGPKIFTRHGFGL